MSDTKTVMMPRELTAANGAKSLFMGEFHVIVEYECEECEGLGHEDNEDLLECDVCEGRGGFKQEIPVSWDMIKDIYRKAVDHLGE